MFGLRRISHGVARTRAIGSEQWYWNEATDRKTAMNNALPALSIRQPWAWLILHSGKDIENRTWRTKYRGPFLIHASKCMTKADYHNCQEFCRSLFGRDVLPPHWEMPQGGIVGEVTLVDCVESSPSPWFCGPYGFVLSDPKSLPFDACRGTLGFFML